MRVKSKWWDKGRARRPEQAATVAAATAWKLGLHTIQRMRGERYEIEAGPRYFAFLREYLVFLVSVADRLAHDRLSPDERAGFTTTMVVRAAELLADSQAEVLGADAAQARREFIDLFNRRGEDYAVFGFDAKEGPDFGFGRFLGNQLLEIVAEQDRSWVIDQVMSIEVPEAFRTLRGALDNLQATSPAAPPPPSS